jgi:hypothetical protein
VLAFELIAERKIAEALERGEFDDLPGRGRPLELEEDRLVPEELRMAYRIVKNAGYVPREVEALSKGEKKLSLLKARVEDRYFSRVVRKLGR